jgi:predicted porin
MMKKILPTMIGIALAGGMTAASADVSVFGHIDTSMDFVDLDLPGNAADFDDVNLNCNDCSVGFKGSEDLGNGLKAIFELDFEYDTTETGNNGENDTFKDRDQWLGLGGDVFGKVRIGSISTVYKSHGAMIDPLYRTALQGRDVGLQSSSYHTGSGEELEGRATNTIRWDSADYSGFKLGAHYTLDNDESDGEDGDPFGIGGSYENGGILVFADYIDNNSESNNLVNPTMGDDSAWKVGGQYTFGDFAVMGQYEEAEFDSAVAGSEDFSIWHVGGSYTMGSNLIYAAYGSAEDEISGLTLDTDSFTIAGVHNMSKSTSVYLGYNNQDGDVSLGTAGTGSADQDKFSLGMKHKF